MAKTHYFCLSAALPPEGTAPVTKHFAPIRAEPGACNCGPEELFETGPGLRLLDLSQEGEGKDLAALLEAAPLYRINTEMLLDEALAARRSDAALAAALEAAYAPQTLPRTLPAPTLDAPSRIPDAQGQLRHPLLSHMSGWDMARFYVSVLEKLSPLRDLARAYGFPEILHKNRARFLKYFDGYILGPTGAAHLPALLASAQRLGEAELAPAASCDIADEALDCYLERALHQYHRARAIDRVMGLGLEGETPEWVRADVRTLLQWEEEKQTCARALLKVGALKGKNDALSQAIARDGQGGHVAPALARLVSETLSSGAAGGAPYSGAAGALAKELSTLTGANGA